MTSRTPGYHLSISIDSYLAKDYEEGTMILHICELCGRWLDVSLSKMITDAFKKIPGIEQPSGQACPNGCGLMRRVEVTDRLCIIEEIRSSAAGHISFTHDGKHFRGELFEVER